MQHCCIKLFWVKVMSIDKAVLNKWLEEGDNHSLTNMDNPLDYQYVNRCDAIKKEEIAYHFEKIMVSLGLDLTDDSLKGTPYRVAKMYVDEIFKGLRQENKPKLSTFENKYQYNNLLIEKNISVNSTCEHHFLPIVGKAHVGYISSGRVIGLSKLNRIVDYYARRPQVQERMTKQIFNELKEQLETEDIIVYLDTEHLCVTSRGITDRTSRTCTIECGGIFLDPAEKTNFMEMIST